MPRDEEYHHDKGVDLGRSMVGGVSWTLRGKRSTYLIRVSVNERFLVLLNELVGNKEVEERTTDVRRYERKERRGRVNGGWTWKDRRLTGTWTRERFRQEYSIEGKRRNCKWPLEKVNTERRVVTPRRQVKPHDWSSSFLKNWGRSFVRRGTGYGVRGTEEWTLHSSSPN